MNKKALDKVQSELNDKRFLHLSQQERIKYKFGLFHGKGKRKKKK